MDVVPFYRNCRENETTWQLKPKITAAASRGFLAAARLFLVVFENWCAIRTLKVVTALTKRLSVVMLAFGERGGCSKC